MAHIFLTWDTFTVSILALAWLRMTSAKPQSVRRSAKLQDSSRTAIFILVIASSCASLLALGFVLGMAKSLPKVKLAEHVVLSLGTVICSWLLVHTMFALRYANLFYAREADKATYAEPKVVIGKRCCFAEEAGVLGDATAIGFDLHSPWG